jgi:hypothetical protein
MTPLDIFKGLHVLDPGFGDTETICFM